MLTRRYHQHAMQRRSFLSLSAAALSGAAAARTRWRVGIIGHTGRGNYGHGIDNVWLSFPEAEIVAVADPDDAGRQRAVERLGAAKGYADYRELLEREKPDIVSICPRHLDQREAMVTAAADAGAHIFSEKPFARDLEEADRMVAAVERAGVKLQLAHQMRASPPVQRAVELAAAGEIGDIQEIRGRGKEDQRAGGEDLMVLGSHIVDVLRMFAGDPQWVFGHVTDNGAEPAKVRRPSEPIGPVAGDQIAAMYAFDGGVHGYLGSKASDATDPTRFGTWVYGSRGVLYLRNVIYPSDRPYLLRSPAWFAPEQRWEPVHAPEEPPAHPDDPYRTANGILVRDLLEAIERDRKPMCNQEDGRWTAEMILGVYRSQQTGARVPLPQAERNHPLGPISAA